MILGFVDPLVLACPENLEDEEGIYSYVARLIAWRDLRNKGWIQMLLPSSAPTAIESTNGFPPWRALANALSKRDLGIQASDVYEVLNSLLNKCPTVEDLAGIREILLDEFSADLDYWSSRRAEQREEFTKLLGIMGLLQLTGEINSEDRQLITTSAPCPHELSFAMVVVDVEYGDNASLRPAFPLNLRDKVTGVCCPRVATVRADYLSVWEAARGDSELRAALELCVAQFEFTERLEAGPWRVGLRFFDSVRQMHLQNRSAGSRVLRACRETIFGQSLGDTHAIRESPGANSAQLKRGNDGAMRRDIDRELHLHYWQTPEGPELAAVVAHNDLTIPE